MGAEHADGNLFTRRRLMLAAIRREAAARKRPGNWAAGDREDAARLKLAILESEAHRPEKGGPA